MTPNRQILLTNLRLFDGRGVALRDGVQVLVAGNRIAAVDGGNNPPPSQAARVDCGGRVLMPGLIDAHWHSILAPMPVATLLSADVGYIHLVASAEAARTLQRGFTTVRDLGGPSFALKHAIDEGLVAGPRILPSGAMITQTSGHGDFRMAYEVPRGLGPSRAEAVGATAIADGPDEVRRRVREQLRLGASQIKLVAGGGVAAPFAPLDVTQFRPEELRAAVEAAADWGTYVTVHAYGSTGIRRSIAAGVRCIEHGQLADEETVRLMADQGAWWSLQPFIEALSVVPPADAGRRGRLRPIWEGTDIAYGLAIRHQMKLGWGTDIVLDPNATARQGAMLAAMKRWFTPAQVLRMATSTNAELLAMAGPRNPYSGKIGIVEKDALADLLVVDGDPTENLELLTDPDRFLRIIMKDGRIHKNTL